MTEMRILTVRQPWAWAIIHGGKNVENRSRNIAGEYRGPVAIHAGLQFDFDGHRESKHLFPANPYAHWRRSDWEFGAIIGVVDLVDVHKAWEAECWRDSIAGSITTCSPWAVGEGYHLVLANPRPLSEPIPYKGALGLRRLPDDVVAQVLAATPEGTP